MKQSFRKWILLLILLILLLPVALYWLADTWLESSGGRQLLERTLSERIGMEVRLEGEFDLMLLPDIGVSGTALVVGGPDPESEFARSESFEISIALEPLLERKVLIEWIRLSGGRVFPERYSRKESSSGKQGFGLPEVRELTIRDFQIVLPGGDDNSLHLTELTISDFADKRQTPFTLEIERLAAVEGRLRWDSSRSLVYFQDLQLSLGVQAVSGRACLYLQSPGALHFELQAGVFDLDAVRENLPVLRNDADGGVPTMEIAGRFVVDELTSSGVIARGVVFSLGEESSCD